MLLRRLASSLPVEAPRAHGVAAVTAAIAEIAVAASARHKVVAVVALMAQVAIRTVAHPVPPLIRHYVPVLKPRPEAPVSITLKATLHGHEVMVTLRGADLAASAPKSSQPHNGSWRQASRDPLASSGWVHLLGSVL